MNVAIVPADTADALFNDWAVGLPWARPDAGAADMCWLTQSGRSLLLSDTILGANSLPDSVRIMGGGRDCLALLLRQQTKIRLSGFNVRSVLCMGASRDIRAAQESARLAHGQLATLDALCSEVYISVAPAGATSLLLCWSARDAYIGNSNE